MEKEFDSFIKTTPFGSKVAGTSNCKVAETISDQGPETDWSLDKAIGFWTEIEAFAARAKKREVVADPEDPELDVLTFKHRSFCAPSAAKSVKITVRRRGACETGVCVGVRTRETHAQGSSFGARIGREFDKFDGTLCFEPGSREVSFEVSLHPANSKDWTAPHWFHVDLVADSVKPVGAAVIDNGRANTTRVLVFDDNTKFPFNIPDAKGSNIIWLVVFYLRGRYADRGLKFRKTMYAMLYYPFHNVVVVAVFERYQG
jgi:hypothetical protein